MFCYRDRCWGQNTSRIQRKKDVTPNFIYGWFLGLALIDKLDALLYHYNTCSGQACP